MKVKPFLLPLLFLLSEPIYCQDLPIKLATIFKNDKALLFKAGSIKTVNGIYSTNILQDALFGTYWVSSTSSPIQSLFIYIDTTEESQPISKSRVPLLANNIGKTVRLFLANSESGQFVEGVLEKVFEPSLSSGYMLTLRSGKKWMFYNSSEIVRADFLEKPSYVSKRRTHRKRLDVKFGDQKPAQDLSVSYLREDIGWTPVYRLEILGKTSGKLSLRAELKNDGENLDSTEIRLAIFTPEFVRSDKKEPLLDFGSSSSLFSSSSFAPRDVSQYETASKVDLTRIQDYIFYTIRPGNFPRGSRFQYPVFEEKVMLKHYFECDLDGESTTTSGTAGTTPKEEYPSFHYVEFHNNSNFPWTEGTVSIMSKPSFKSMDNKDSVAIKYYKLMDSITKYGGDLEPISQEDFPYTSISDSCKIRVSKSPDIEVTQIESSNLQTANAKKLMNKNFDLIVNEGQLAVINRSGETALIKIFREVQGMPIQSEVKWSTKQELSTLQINSTHKITWEIELKPKEKKEWKYSYGVFEDSNKK